MTGPQHKEKKPLSTSSDPQALPEADAAASYRKRRAEASAGRRQNVLQAANAGFCRDGYRKTSVERIAQEAGVSKALVFAFFGSKKKLFRAVVGETMAEWRKFSEAQAKSHGDDPREELRQLFTGSFAFVERYPMLWPMLGYSDSEWQALWPEMAALNRAWQERLAEVLDAGAGQGVFRADLDARKSAEVIHEIQRSLLARLFAAPQGVSDIVPLIALAATIIVDGLSVERGGGTLP